MDYCYILAWVENNMGRSTSFFNKGNTISTPVNNTISTPVNPRIKPIIVRGVNWGTTTQLREAIAGGSTRDQLPSKSSGSSVTSTVDSAQRAYLAAINRARVTAEFRAAQQQTARQASQERTSQRQSVADNSKNLPSYTAQNQIYNSTPNNIVNPSSLFPSQPIVTNGQGQNSTIKYGVNTNANYNYASQMNDFQNSNPTSQINLGQSPEPYFTAGKSSIPYDNEVKTSLLGGDIQHQETDVNTNLEYEKPLSQQSQSNVNWAQQSSIGFGIIPLAAIGALFFLGKRK